MSRRAGTTLVELLIAAVLGAAVATAATALWRAQRRAADASSIRARGELGAQEILDLVGALVRSAASARLAGDSALVVRQVVREGILCADGRGLRPVPGLDGGGGVSASGDQWWVGGADSSAGDWRWVPIADSIATGAPTADGCAPMVPARVVRVTRTAVIGAYHTGDGDWMVGARTCTALACGVVQPIAGPVRSRAAGGFRVRLDGPALFLSVRVPGPSDTVLRALPWP